MFLWVACMCVCVVCMCVCVCLPVFMHLWQPNLLDFKYGSILDPSQFLTLKAHLAQILDILFYS